MGKVGNQLISMFFCKLREFYIGLCQVRNVPCLLQMYNKMLNSSFSSEKNWTSKSFGVYLTLHLSNMVCIWFVLYVNVFNPTFIKCGCLESL